MRAALTSLVQQAGYGLRERGLGCRRAAISLVYTDGVQLTRQAVAKTPAADDQALQHLALTALYRAWQRRVRVRQLVLSCSLLQHPVQQLSLFAAVDRSRERNRQISEACDAIRTRCGAAAIYRGSQGALVAGAPLSP